MQWTMRSDNAPVVAVVMGSVSDYGTLQHSTKLLTALNIPCLKRVVSAHRAPETMREFALKAESVGIKVIIAGAGAAAHLPGMLAAWTHLPILGVPIESGVLKGVDSLLSIVQMPSGVPVPTLAIGKAGAINAALAAASILSLTDRALRKSLLAFRSKQTEKSQQSTLADTVS